MDVFYQFVFGVWSEGSYGYLSIQCSQFICDWCGVVFIDINTSRIRLATVHLPWNLCFCLYKIGILHWPFYGNFFFIPNICRTVVLFIFLRYEAYPRDLWLLGTDPLPSVTIKIKSLNIPQPTCACLRARAHQRSHNINFFSIIKKSDTISPTVYPDIREIWTRSQALSNICKLNSQTHKREHWCSS